MSFESINQSALDYLPCRYGKSKLLFRGPQRNLRKPYAAFLGSNETYGKFIEEPFVDLLDQNLGVSCINFGCLNAGVDVFVQDDFICEAAQNAALTVLQVPSAQNMTNRLYSVHPRRNDRFVAPTPILQAMFPEVDFAGFHFNKHMIKHLRELSPERFAAVKQELAETWSSRMNLLLIKIDGPVILLWVSSRKPDDPSGFDVDPMYVTQAMVDRVAPNCTRYVEVILSEDACKDPTDGMVFSQMEAPAAREMMGPKAHMEVADALYPVIQSMI